MRMQELPLEILEFKMFRQVSAALLRQEAVLQELRPKNLEEQNEINRKLREIHIQKMNMTDIMVFHLN